MTGENKKKYEQHKHINDIISSLMANVYLLSNVHHIKGRETKMKIEKKLIKKVIIYAAFFSLLMVYKYGEDPWNFLAYLNLLVGVLILTDMALKNGK